MQRWQPRALTGVAFLLAAVLLFARLGDLPLIDPDEGRNAEVAREMAESGAWVVPTFNAIPYLDKPALYFRAVALSFNAFGRTETTARLPSALSAAVLVVMMFVFCRRVYGERTAALTVLVLATTPLVIGFARLVIFDMPLRCSCPRPSWPATWPRKMRSRRADDGSCSARPRARSPP
jgi:4-amino-4-deoxy-L-arabinose transferase-like glycosyltransferase